MTKIITIEGTDGAGKATQSKLLKQKLEEFGYKVKLISFPNYENKISSYYVSKYLCGEIHTADPMLIANFYAIDRALTLSNIFLGEYDYVIFDRYTQSNMIYQGSLKILNEPFLLFNKELSGITWECGFSNEISDNNKKIQILESITSNYENDIIINMLTDAFSKAFFVSNEISDMEKKLHIPEIDMCIYLKLDPEIAKSNRISRGRATDIIERDEQRMIITDIYGRFLAKFNSASNGAQKWVVIDCDDGETMLSTEKINEKILTEVQKWYD